MSLTKRLDTAAKKLSRILRGDTEDAQGKIEEVFRSVCAAVRYSVANDSTVDHSERSALIEKAHGILNEGEYHSCLLICSTDIKLEMIGVEWCYGDEDSGVDFISSFAHTEGTLVENGESKVLGSVNDEAIEQLLAIMTRMAPPNKKTGLEEDLRKQQPRTKPWWEAPLLHPKTTPLSHFKAENLQIPPETSPRAFALYQALAEITVDNILNPASGLCISLDNQFIAVAGAGGYKERTPYVSFADLEDTHDSEGFSISTTELGFGDIANEIALDSGRKLVWLSDGDRIKSYSWAPEHRGRKGLLPTHTLASPSGVSGPILVRPDGRILQGGQGKIAFWNVDSLKTHGPKGTKRIGKAISTEDTWRDEDDEIEDSSGSKIDGIISLQDQPMYSIATWHPHPASSSQVLCASEARSEYSLISVDLEAGQRVQRYLGHGGAINTFSTDAVSAPNTFLSSCSDSYARIYDSRQPLPVLTFEAENDSSCKAAVYAHPNSLPFVFTGGLRSENIRLWDVRARKLVYELSTGNTAVEGLSWDPERNTLYVATQCLYLGRMGDHYDYRIAKRPKPPQESLAVARSNDPKYKKTKTVYPSDDEDGGDENMEDAGEEVEYWQDYNTEYDSEEEEDYEPYETKCWPSRAHKPESYFRRMHDSGVHCLYRYKFTSDADPEVYPAYGQATLERDIHW